MSWGDIFEFVIDAAAVGTVGYLAYKDIESIVEWTNALTQASEDEAVDAIVKNVPRMDNDTWNVFYGHISEKAKYDGYANALREFSLRVRYS